MFGKRVSISTSVATVLAVSVTMIGAGAAIAGSTEPPAWQKGLHARSEALNQKYGLGDRASAPLSASSVSSVRQPDWLRALQLRSEAMNRRYGLGRDPLGAVTNVRRTATASNARAGHSHTGPGHRRRHAAGAVTNVRCYATARNSLSGLGQLCARPSPS
jgi:hypothetical protein